MARESSGLRLWLGRRLKGENACAMRIYVSNVCGLDRVEVLGEVPKTQHTRASVLRVGWNASQERDLGLLDRTMVHVVQKTTCIKGTLRHFKCGVLVHGHSPVSTPRER